jgi:hypothetical protein
MILVTSHNCISNDVTYIPLPAGVTKARVLDARYCINVAAAGASASSATVVLSTTASSSATLGAMTVVASSAAEGSIGTYTVNASTGKTIMTAASHYVLCTVGSCDAATMELEVSIHWDEFSRST